CGLKGAAVFGIDRSPSMLAKAREKLDGSAGLYLGDAARMPYRAGVFDLIAVSMALHEMAPATRSAVIEEARRLLAAGGQLLVVDYHSGPVCLPLGRILKLIGFCAEMAAGGDHFRNYREFMAGNGLTALMTAHRLQIVRQVPVWRGTIAVSLLDFAL
ncbi:MAG: class I SAM-dependent methyltransferase, partial [Desulfobacterales bacterium]